MAGTPYYEAGSAAGKIQANLVFSLAIQTGKMAPQWSRKKKKLPWSYYNI